MFHSFVVFTTLTMLVIVLLACLSRLRVTKMGEVEKKSLRTWVGELVTDFAFSLTILSLKFFTKIGADMSTVDEAIGRFTTWGQSVLAQLKSAQESNASQTELIAQLNDRISQLTANDESDAAEIARLQGEIDTLQNDIAAKINAAVDSLENPPAPEEPSDPVTPEEPSEPEVPVDPETPAEPEVPSEGGGGETPSELPTVEPPLIEDPEGTGQ